MVDVTLRVRRYTLGGRKQDSSLKIAIELNFKVLGTYMYKKTR